MKSKLTVLSVVLLAIVFTSQPLTALSQQTGPPVANDSKMTYMPDLVIHKVTMGDPTLGDFQVVVQNRGKGNATFCQLRLWVKDQTGKTFALVELSQPALGPGESATVKISAEKALGAYYKYEITTDSSKNVSEANEGNNIWKGNTGKV